MTESAVEVGHLVVGAGLTGCLLAARLADRGNRVLVLDRRPDPRRHDVDEGRSINLALSTRGIDALAAIGLDGWVREHGLPMGARLVHVDGSISAQRYGTHEDHVLWSVNRDGLNAALLDAVDTREGAELRLGTGVDDLRLGEPVRVELDDDAVVTAGTVYGADGAYSAVRSRLLRTRGFDYEQDYLEHGYKELTIPPGPAGGHLLAPDGLHIWPRRDHMLIALPNTDGSFTCTLFWPLEERRRGDAPASPVVLADRFAADFPDAAALMPDLVEEYRTNPVGSLVTIRCSPWNRADHVVLLGDAAHAVVPFYGQGANAALEDVTILMDLLDEHPTQEAAFTAFSRERKPQTDALAELALDNYIEMRDHVASPLFRLARLSRRFVARLAPDRFTPLYTMVTFTRMPYDEARRRADRQDRIAVAVGALLVLLVLAAVALAMVRLAG